jgi:D-arabinose 1-dehydrogenase
MAPSTRPPLASVLPPIICGTATFNVQYNADPFKIPANEIVQKALEAGVCAFDTSPYYGPSEEILGMFSFFIFSILLSPSQIFFLKTAE